MTYDYVFLDSVDKLSNILMLNSTGYVFVIEEIIIICEYCLVPGHEAATWSTVTLVGTVAASRARFQPRVNCEDSLGHYTLFSLTNN